MARSVSKKSKPKKQPAHTATIAPVTLRLPDSPAALIGSAQLRAMLGGISSMTIYRWLHGEPWRDDRSKTALVPDFPPPIKIAGRNYWRLGAVQKFIAQRERSAVME